MFTEKDILTRLQNGESADSIAKSMADTLNAATKTYNDEMSERAKKTQLQKDKEYAMRNVLEDFRDYLEDFTDLTPEDITSMIDAVDVSKMVKMVDELVELSHSLEKLADSLDKANKKSDSKDIHTTPLFSGGLTNIKFDPKLTTLVSPVKRDPTVVLDEFLRKNGL